MSVLGKMLAGNSDSSRHVLNVLGRQVPVKLIDQGVKLGWERQFYADARQRAAFAYETDRDEAVAAGIPPAALGLIDAEYNARLEDLSDDNDAGKFALLSKRGCKALSEPEGIVRLLSLLTGLTRAELFSAVRDRAAQPEINAVVATVIAESFPDELPGGADANAKKKSAA